MIKILETILIALIIVSVMASFTFLVLKSMSNQYDDLGIYCDERYGKNNWFLDEASSQERREMNVSKFFIGQVWKCRQYGGERK